jgi:uncharacterized GH25 family protein
MTFRLLLGAALLSLAPAASAHRQWFLPSGTVFSGTDSWVTVDAAVSNDLFFLDHQPMRLDNVKAWAPDGSPAQIQNGSTGRYRSTFDVKLDKPGTWKIGTSMSGVMGSFKLNGEERRVGGRGGPPPGAQGAPGAAPGMAAAGGPQRPPSINAADIPAEATDVKLTETMTRNEIFVTAGEPTTTVFKPTGKGLELDPVTHPDELVAGETAKFRFLVDGKPAPNLKVTVIPGGKRYRDAEGAMDLTTGADGVLSVKWPTAGMYWLNATLEDDKPTAPRATARRLGYVTTLEVMTP